MKEAILRPATYYLTFAALIGLTVLTVVASFLPLHAWHTAIGLLFATAKALLVALFFMHLLHSPRINWLAVGVGLFWLAILLALTLSDYLARPLASY
jgi:cytochrome c oxidase subunit 4